MSQRTDPELVDAFKAGDITGFNELVRKYQEKVYWIARRVLNDHEDADDITQEVFVRVYEGLKAFRGESNVYTWIYRIAMNLSLNANRKRRLKDLLPFDDYMAETVAGDMPADGQMQREEYRTILERAINTLPARQKMVFEMRYYEEMPYEEMAKIMKRSVGGLKANYFHALKKIQDFVKKEMGL